MILSRNRLRLILNYFEGMLYLPSQLSIRYVSNTSLVVDSCPLKLFSNPQAFGSVKLAGVKSPIVPGCGPKQPSRVHFEELVSV